jgi:lipopolysaccharide export LptBFGC system permease protein LptF
MIPRLDKVIFRELVLLTVLCTLGLTFLFSALSLYQIVNHFEVTPHIGTLMAFGPSLVVSLLPLTLPISALFAASLVYGRMRAERELMLYSASGVAPWRAFVPLLPVGLLVAAASGYGVSEYGPEAYAERHTLQRQALADFLDNPPQGPRELRFPGASGSRPSIDISYESVAYGDYHNLTIFVYNDAGLLASLQARSARIDYQRHSGMLVLSHCFEPRLVQFEPTTGRPVGAPLIAEKVTDLRMPFPLGSEDGPSGSKALRTLDLIERAQEERERESSRRSAAGEIVRRAGLAIGGLLLPLLGALLAAQVSHPNRLLAIGVGVIPAAVGYYPLMTAATTLAENATLSVPVALMLAPAVMIAACFAFALKITRGRWSQ